MANTTLSVNDAFEKKIKREIKDIDESLEKIDKGFYLTHASVFTNDTIIEKIALNGLKLILESNITVIKDEEKPKVDLFYVAKHHFLGYMRSLQRIRLDYGCSHMTEQRINLKVNKRLFEIYLEFVPEDLKSAYDAIYGCLGRYQ